MSAETNDFARFERESWERVAASYEATWSGLTRPFIPHLLEAVGVTAGTRLLDVACGPGYVAEAAHALAAEPIGVDFTPEMVHLARDRNPEIEFRRGDAEALDFEDDMFDAVAMNFGVLHLPNPEAAFSEARRVLRPSGRTDLRSGRPLRRVRAPASSKKPSRPTPTRTWTSRRAPTTSLMATRTKADGSSAGWGSIRPP